MKRRGFTLIELMVVIAIIIILAAIAIPNYLKMTERAKKSRIASDMATLATGLETFKTDWGSYPTTAGAGVLVWAPISADHIPFDELGGTAGGLLGGAGTTATINIATATNALGEAGGIEYLKPGTLLSIVDPFKKAAGAPATHDDGFIYYTSDGAHWICDAYLGTSATEVYTWRTDSSSKMSTAVGIPVAY